MNTHRPSRLLSIRLAVMLALAFDTALQAAPAVLRPLREGTELFVDEAKISRREKLTRTLHAAQKLAQPVIVPDQPWEEGRIYIYGTTYVDPATGTYHMWYAAPGRMLYATSPDGLRWTKPELDGAAWEGRKTNIVFAESYGGVVLVDETEPDAARRFKALVAAPIRVGGFSGHYSADGIHWTRYGDDRILTVGSEIGHLIRDPATKKYFAYIRPYPPKHFPKNVNQKRLGAVVTSDDFVNWSEMKVVLTPDAVDDAWVTKPEQRTEFYAMNGFAYGQSYLGVIPLFRITGIHDQMTKEQSRYDGPMEGQLITSRDGLDWQRMKERNPVIPSGPTFDQSIMNVAVAPIIVGDEVWHYYTGINTTHGGPMPPKRISVCLAKWRLDGFASLDAGADEGSVETVTLPATASGALEVNASAGGGSLAVEVLDANGAVLPGYSARDFVRINSDSIRHVAKWRERALLPSGQPYRLRFVLRQASLYSYTVKRP